MAVVDEGGNLVALERLDGTFPAGANISVGKAHGQPGSNGLTFDSVGRLAINEHGNRRVTPLEHDRALTVLAGRFEGKRLNSPNDLVYQSDDMLYFTAPPF